MPETRDVVIDGDHIQTGRLNLRRWQPSDAQAAMTIYGSGDVAKWLAPAMTQIPDIAAMRELLSCWAASRATLERPAGR